MKRMALAVFAAGLSFGAQADELPLKRVVLSTSGLAQFSHAGEAAAGSALELPVRLDQVDDLLKSLTIFDREGALGAVSLPGQSPLSELFRDLPFSPDALNSQAALLNALAGADIEIEGNVTAKGRVFRVEEERVQLPNNGGQTVRHRLTVLTDKGFMQAILEELPALRFTDPKTKMQIDRALLGLAENRAKERRTLSIGLLGQGKRAVGFSYVVAAPVWKTSYRLVLPKESGKARLQGWGVVENLTGSDWKDVELSLISGSPVALKQALYSAFYVDRPEIPVQASLRLLPRLDDVVKESREQGFAGDLRGYTERGLLEAEKPLAKVRERASSYATAANTGEDAPVPQPAAPEEFGKPAMTASAEDAATQVLYRFPAKVSLASGSSMMVPYVDREVSAQRTFLYQPDTNARHPLAALKLHNDGEAALPAGILTAFEMGDDGAANFAGDAQLPLTPKGAEKFVTFAIDSKTNIRRSDNGSKQTWLGKAVRGELTVSVKSRWTIDYEITPPADEDRDIVIDEARFDDWKSTGEMKDLEETPARLRFKVAAPKGKTTKVTLARDHTDQQLLALSALDADGLLTTISGLENGSPALKEAVATLGALVTAVNEAKAHRKKLETEHSKITDDQKRLRENLKIVGQGSDLGRRYLDKLNGQEDRLAAIASEDESLEKLIASKQKAAQELAQSLSL
jgi:hypothetical protein